MKDQVSMIPASGNEADEIQVLTQKVEEMKRKGLTVKGDQSIQSKPMPKKDEVNGSS